MAHEDFDFEPIRGLPAHLPEGEKIIWQGAPNFIGLAIRAFHVRKVAIYFAALILLRFIAAYVGGQDIYPAFNYAIGVLPLALAAIGILSLIAWGYARTSVYTLTSKRFVLRSGIAMPITLNLPLSHVDSVALRLFGDGSGDIPLSIRKTERVAALVVWPHMRPWTWGHPQPMLRSVPDAGHLAGQVKALLAGEQLPARPPAVQAAAPAPQAGINALHA
ncbi:MAG: PH domain-containing protein [Methylocystis sp.]|nr:PH domain-containing protein [Methylocystis sp.]MCA3583740.1 PH domain-containing protein [Methylocystis sp.]MCA3587047.1 PH domain-containing protein [Methylocystis sp.]MCA3589986.1 PH domain-containing protein [Methylocystis sp.]